MTAALTKSAHPGPFLISQAGAGGRQVTRAAAESREAAAGEDEGSTGSSLGRRGRGLGRKRKAATGDAAAPPPGMRQRVGASAALTGDVLPLRGVIRTISERASVLPPRVLATPSSFAASFARATHCDAFRTQVASQGGRTIRLSRVKNRVDRIVSHSTLLPFTRHKCWTVSRAGGPSGHQLAIPHTSHSAV